MGETNVTTSNDRRFRFIDDGKETNPIQNSRSIGWSQAKATSPKQEGTGQI